MHYYEDTREPLVKRLRAVFRLPAKSHIRKRKWLYWLQKSLCQIRNRGTLGKKVTEKRLEGGSKLKNFRQPSLSRNIIKRPTLSV